jgi:hypothetical protein
MSVLLYILCVIGFFGTVQAEEVNHAQAKAKVQYLLSIDRIDFYNQNLADFLENKRSPELVQALRNLKPEDFFAQKFTSQELDSAKEWQKLIYNTLTKKNPSLAVNFADLEWNYDFFKNKLALRFGVKDSKVPAPGYEMESGTEVQSERSIPRIKGSKILLDTERYIAEKTSRAIIWDAIVNGRDFGFFVGTQSDFQEQIHKNKLEIIAEVQPMARNYNKIYLTYNGITQRYSYSMNLISGDDRIKHLGAQLRLIKFQGKSYLNKSQDKIHVYGSATQFHKSQEAVLTGIFGNLPKADKIVIGQKGAIDEVIKSAGMLDVISKNAPEILAGLKVEKTKVSKFEKLLTNVNAMSSFLSDSALPGSVMDQAYALANDPIERAYKQFDSEQASHEFTDYLLEDKNGNIKRWRVFSAVWGDEIIPIARALKNTGHKDVVYIGTAGAIANKGLKVGDVIAADHVYTHSGKKLKFNEGTLVKNERAYGVGQVHTPFDETDKWLAAESPKIDAVEVETGYLREQLGEGVKLEAYLLISDVVGSESETLAHAAQSSSKRKKGQLKLLENLFVQNGIVAPISNYEMMPTNRVLKVTYEKIRALRPSREEFSLLQVAQLAVRQGKTSAADLEVLLKNQPAFTRADMSNAIYTLGGLLAEIQKRQPEGARVGIISESFLTGAFNPKVKTVLTIEADGLTSKEEVIQKIGRANWNRYESALSKYFTLEIAANAGGLVAKRFQVKSAEDFYRTFEDIVLKTAGFISEIDKNGTFRARPIPGIGGAVRCEILFR